MTAATYTVKVTVDTRWAIRWVRLMRFIAPIVGYQRACRWAVDGACRLTRTRIGK